MIPGMRSAMALGPAAAAGFDYSIYLYFCPLFDLLFSAKITLT
jgi:hypothetical protein